METKFNFDLRAKVSCTGRVMLYTRLYVIVCVCDGSEKVLRYCLNRPDAETCVCCYSDNGYENVRINEEIVYL